MSEPSDSKASRRPPGRRARPRQPVAEEPLPSYDFQRDSLGYALRRAQVRAYELYFSMLSSVGLSPARLTALSLVAQEPGLNQAALAQRLGITGPSALRMVDALESAGLLSRASFAGDRRSHALVLTPLGQEKLDELARLVPGYETRIADRLSSEERALLLSLLERVAVSDGNAGGR